MSYILDALKKAEKDRSRGKVPDLKQAIQDSPKSRERSSAWIFGVILLNLLLVAAVIWIVKDRIPWPGATEVAPREVVRVTQPGPSRNSEAQNIDEVVSPPQPAMNHSQEPAGATRELSLSELRKLQAAKQPARPAGSSSGKPLPEPPQEAEIEAQSVDQGIPPPLRDMPVDFRRSLPELELNAYFYSADPQRRFVLINMQRYSETDSLPPGLVVEKITPEGVILEYRNERFLLPR